MQYLHSFLALDIAAERHDDVFSMEFGDEWEAREARQAAALAARRQKRPSIARRALAHGFAWVSRGSAAAARRLDAVATDDVGRTLAPSK